MKKFFTSCILLCLLGQAQVCAGASSGTVPEKSVPEKPVSFWDLVVDVKKLFRQKTNTFLPPIKEKFAPTEEDMKNLEGIKKGYQQNIAPLVDSVKQTVVDPMLNVCFKAPVKIIASGPSQDPKKVAEKKYKQTVYDLREKMTRDENKKIWEKLKPYCPDGKPESLAERIDKKNAHQEQMDLRRTEKDQLGKGLEELKTTIARSQVSYRSDSKTTLVILSSILCGASTSALIFHLLDSLSQKMLHKKKIRRCRKQLENLTIAYQDLEGNIKKARRALKKGISDDGIRAKVKKFLRDNVPLLRKQRKKIILGNITLFILQTKFVARSIGVPFISVMTGAAAALTSFNLFSQIWPASTPPEISTSPEKMAELEKSLATTNEKYAEVSKSFNELEQIGKTMPAIPQEAKLRLIEWQQSESAVKNAANLANKDRNEQDRRTGEAAGLLTNAYTNQLNNMM